jgi:DNA-binding MarR family transcriptional regulator
MMESRSERVNAARKKPPDHMLELFRRMRKIAFSQHPLQDGEVTMPQLTLLDWLARSPGASIVEIAEGLALTAPTVSVTVSQMEQAGWLERRPNPADARALQVHLTNKGSALQQRAYRFRLDKMRRLLKGLGEEEKILLLALLEKAISHAEGEETG